MPTLLHWGLHPEASMALASIDVTGGMISQTIGSAPASAGYHAQDGTVDGQPYCAAVDLRTKGMTDLEAKVWLDKLGQAGFAAWLRQPGRDGWPLLQIRHIHCVYSGIAMKVQLRQQIHAYCAGMNGLVTNRRYTFHPPLQASINKVRDLFLNDSGNPVMG